MDSTQLEIIREAALQSQNASRSMECQSDVQNRHSVITDQNLEAEVRRLAVKASRSRAIVVTLIGTVGLPAMFLGLVQYLRIGSFEPSAQTILLLSVPFLIVLPHAMSNFLSSRQRAVVLWIRRFHQGHKAHAEQRFLEVAVLAAWGRTLTLSDTSVSSSAVSRIAFWKWALLVIMVYVGAQPFVRADLKPLLVSIATVLWLFRKNPSTVQLDKANWFQQIHSAVEDIRSTSSPHHGSFVISCPREKEIWQDVIKGLMPKVDAVILSTGDTSTALEWEAQLAIEELGANKVIALVWPGQATRVEIPDRVRVLNVLQRVYYPFGLLRAVGERWVVASTIIGAAIASPRAVRSRT